MNAFSVVVVMRRRTMTSHIVRVTTTILFFITSVVDDLVDQLEQRIRAKAHAMDERLDGKNKIDVKEVE